MIALRLRLPGESSFLQPTGLLSTVSVIILLLLLFVLPSPGQVLITRQEVRHDVSPPLRDLATTAQPPENGPREAEPLRLIPLPDGLKPPDLRDPVRQSTVSKAPESLAPVVINNFDGLGQGVPPGFSPCCAPPDTNGAVGLTQYVQWVNLSFAVFDKTTGNITLGPLSGNTLWKNFGGDCETSNDGDPIVVYDKLADRWVFSQFVVHRGNGPFFQCVAVSTTSDATGSFNRYSFSYSNFDDYPKMGVWPDAYYVTFNMFSSFSFLGADACAYDRNAMLNGQPATQICFQQGSSVGSLLPSDVDGRTAPPAGSPNFMMTFGANSVDLFKFNVDFATPGNSTFTGPTSIPVADFTPLCNGGRNCVPEPGDPNLLDGLGDRLMYRLAYRNFGDHESLVVNHSVAVGAFGGVRWYEIQNPNGTPIVAQQSTFAPDSNFRWMGSVAMDQDGDLALGYSVSNSNVFPSVAFAGRRFSDPASILEAETTIINGTGTQNGFLTRWGDYSAMQVDPSDDCTFWYTNEYLKNSGSFNWNTRIASFKFPSCGAPDLTIAKSHTGNFTQGQQGATYTITVTNIGAKSTKGTVTVVDTLPAKLTATAFSGTGWSCTLGTLTCTRTDALAASASYPAITLTLNVAADAPGKVTNSVTVSGGGETDTTNDTATDPTTIIQTGPDPAVTKSHSGVFIQGETGNYTLTVANTGLSPTDGTQVTVTDALPAGLTASAASGTGWSCMLGPTVSCSRIDVLASNASYPAITLTVNVANNAPASVINNASVAGGGDTNNLNNNASDATRIIPPPPDLTITKTHAFNFTQGLNGMYTLTVSNIGKGSAAGAVSVTDTLPAGLTLSSSGMGGNGWSCVSSTLTCTRSDVLAPSGSYPPITVFVDVSGDAPPSVTNTATVSGGGDITPGNNTASDPTIITQVPDLTIISSHSPEPFVVGQSGTYTIVVKNVGHGPTSAAVTVQDFMPFGLGSNAITGNGWSCSFLNCTRSDPLAPGSSYPPITITVDVLNGPSGNNIAEVSGGGEFNFNNDTASDFTTIKAPVLAITESHNGDFIAGEPGTYTIIVSNTGTSGTVGTVGVNDTLPNGLTVIGASGAGWTCSSPFSNFVNCLRSDSLAAGNSYPPIHLIVSVNGGAPSVINTVTVSGGSSGSFETASDFTKINATSLGLSTSHAGSFTVGHPGTFTVTVTNVGKSPTVGTVTVSDNFPFGLTATAVSAGWACPGLPSTLLICTRSDELRPGQSYPPMTVTVQVDAGAPAITNSVNVSGGGDGVSHSASELININGATFALTLSHSGNFTAGQPGAYTIIVSNPGKTASAGLITAQDSLPFGLQATAMSGAGWNCVISNFPRCTRTDALAPGSSFPPITLTVSVAGGATSVTNNASVFGGGASDIATATDVTNIMGPVLGLTKSHTGNFVVGQPATYTLVVNNSGNGATFGTVTVHDDMPFTFTATAVDASGWNCSSLPTVSLNCTRSDPLAANASYPPIIITASLSGGSFFASNTASVSGGGDAQFHFGSDGGSIASPTLAIVKSHTGDFTVGQTGTYAIVVSNMGNLPSSGTVTVTDALPSGLAATSTTGTGWSCSGTATVTCTRSDALAASSSYPAITLTVNVGGGGPSVINSATLTGGGDFPRSTTDVTRINASTLAITKTHTGDFTVGQNGTYTIGVSNVGTTATAGTVTMTDVLPSSMSAASVGGTGWNCSGVSTITCTRSDALAAGSSYPPITLAVSVGGNVGASLVTNTATVTGGGDGVIHSASDPTNVNAATLAITKSHNGTFTAGQSGSYLINVSNPGNVASAGNVVVTDSLPAGLSATAITAPGWSCSPLPATVVTCSRSDSLAGSASYPAITLTVSVDPNVQPLVINQATLTGGGDLFHHVVKDPTAINLPDLAITATRSGDFTIGQTGSYTLTVSNVGGIPTSAGTLTVSDFVPGGLTATSASGTGWTCSVDRSSVPQVSCTRSGDVLAPGNSYPPISLNVNVAADATPIVTNVASVFGIGDADFSNNIVFSDTTISGFRFVPVTPCRIADTRNPTGPFGGPFLAGGATRGFTVPDSACSIPATAQAYSINATVVPKSTLGFLTMFPCGQPLPLASTLNSIDGRIKAGATILPAGTGGAVCAFATNDTELVLDINGYFVPASDPAGLEFYPLTPCRLVDTRGPVAPLGGPSMVGNAARSFPILSSTCNVPSAAKAYSLNYTSVPRGNLGFLTTWPAGQTQPLVSTLNAPTGAVTANGAIVPAGTNGDISVFVTNSSDLVIDIDGYFAPPGVGGLSLFPLTPCRVIDTRNPAGSQPFNGTINVDTVGSGCNPPASAQAFVFNATVIPPGPLGFLTLWPQGAPQPLASTLNAGDAAITSNMAIVPTTNGSISAFGANPTHLVLDISGFFAP